MAVKLVTLFLIGIVAMAVFGRLRLGGKPRGSTDRVENATKCPDCGAFVLGDGPCVCKLT